MTQCSGKFRKIKFMGEDIYLMNGNTVIMKKLLICFMTVLSFVLLGGCDVNEMSSLKEISKPYVGTFVCEELLYGEVNRLPLFEVCRLTLRADETFELYMKTQTGEQASYVGEYRCEKDLRHICFDVSVRSHKVSRSFAYESGKIIVEENIGGRLLFARFVLFG